MNFYELINSHRSIRKYKPEPVPQDVLNRILGAAVRASSSGNMQSHSIIVTQDPMLRKKLYPLHFKQSMVLEAPVVLTFCSDFHRMRQWLKLSKAPDNFNNFMSFMIGAIDAILASQNAALAAEHEGLGICYMGTTLANCQKIAKVLKCPKNVVPVVGFTLGYPAETPPARDRLPLTGMIHEDTYKDYTNDNIQKIYQEREIKGLERYQSYPELKKLIIKSNVKNLAQIYTKLKYTKASHIRYSKTVLDCIKDQDFFNFGTKI